MHFTFDVFCLFLLGMNALNKIDITCMFLRKWPKNWWRCQGMSLNYICLILELWLTEKFWKETAEKSSNIAIKQVSDSEPMTTSLTGHVNKDTHPTLSLMITDDWLHFMTWNDPRVSWDSPSRPSGFLRECFFLLMLTQMIVLVMGIMATKIKSTN